MKRRIAALLLLVMTMLLIAAPAQASKKGATTKSFISLKQNEVCSKYDFTHNGKADKLKVVFDEPQMEWTIYLNGKVCGSAWGGQGYTEAYVFAPTSKNAMLVFTESTSQTIDAYVYRYSGGKFKQVYANPLGEGAMGRTTPEKVSKKAVTVILSNTGIDNSVFDQDSKVKFRVTYKVSSNGKFTLKSRKNPAVGNKTFTAVKSFTTGSSATGDKTDGPRVKSGQKVTVKSLYIRKNTSYTLYEIEVDGKTGWINGKSWGINNWPLLK